MHSQEDERNFQGKGQAWIHSSKRVCSLPSSNQMYTLGIIPKPWPLPRGSFKKNTTEATLWGEIYTFKIETWEIRSMTCLCINFKLMLHVLRQQRLKTLTKVGHCRSWPTYLPKRAGMDSMVKGNRNWSLQSNPHLGLCRALLFGFGFGILRDSSFSGSFLLHQEAAGNHYGLLPHQKEFYLAVSVAPLSLVICCYRNF